MPWSQRRRFSAASSPRPKTSYACVGKRLIPRLIAGGYDVAAMTRSPEKTDALRVAGAKPVVADGLDRTAVMQAVMRAEPEVVIHQMTALTAVTSFRKF